jgi:glycosyltransferase involved in cell wall biosynthesis
MRLLHVIGSMDPAGGGPCQGIRSLAEQLSGGGHSVEVVCLDSLRPEYLNERALQIHALGRPRGSWKYHPRLRPWLERNLPRFDAAILNGLWLYQGLALLRVARDCGTPYFIFPHGMLDPWFQRAAERRMKAARNWLYWKLCEQRVVHRAAGLFFTCAAEMELARGTFQPYRPRREISVGYGVAEPPSLTAEMTGAFFDRCPGLGGQPYFLFLSRIHYKKGIDLLIRAYARLCRQRGALTVPKLVIAGPGGETDYGKELCQLAREVCEPDSIFWPGMLTGPAKWGALGHCEAFVLPSHQENFGIAVAEALACGKPVLISNQINIWQEIDAYGAALVQPDTVSGTAQLLSDWLNLSHAAKVAMGQRARVCFQELYSIEVAARRLQATLSSVLTEANMDSRAA